MEQQPHTHIRIALADDEMLFRKGIAFLLGRESDIEIVLEASDGQELVDYLKESHEHPDIVLMDLKMPCLNGVETTKILNRNFPNIRIIALTSYNTKPFIANMIQVGAVSYIVKNASPDEMIHTIRQVAEKGFYYNEEVMQIIRSGDLRKTPKSLLDNTFLTQRELEILEGICQQKNSAEISAELYLSQRTVEGHRTNLLVKTGSRNIAGLVVFAIQNRLVNIGGLD